MGRFSGQGVTCRGRSHRIVKQMQGRSNTLHADRETESISAVTAAGNAALSRQLRFLRNRDLHHPHPAEGSKLTRTNSRLPPKVSNTMVFDEAVQAISALKGVVASVASLSHAVDPEVSGIQHVGAMLPADVNAIKINLTDPDVDVSSDDSTEDVADLPAAYLDL
jgi:hypothetical protein